MSTYRLPLTIPTRQPWWSRLLNRAQEAWANRRAPASSRSRLVNDWYPLRDLPDSLQRDIGVPESLREHAQQLRERDALWLRY